MKPSRPRKLSLQRQTVRSLAPTELVRVAGASGLIECTIMSDDDDRGGGGSLDISKRSLNGRCHVI